MIPLSKKISLLTHLCKYTLRCFATIKAVPCRRQVFSLSPMGCCNFHYVETTQTTLQGWECSANRAFKEGQFIDITESLGGQPSNALDTPWSNYKYWVSCRYFPFSGTGRAKWKKTECTEQWKGYAVPCHLLQVCEQRNKLSSKHF